MLTLASFVGFCLSEWMRVLLFTNRMAPLNTMFFLTIRSVGFAANITKNEWSDHSSVDFLFLHSPLCIDIYNGYKYIYHLVVACLDLIHSFLFWMNGRVWTLTFKFVLGLLSPFIAYCDDDFPFPCFISSPISHDTSWIRLMFFFNYYYCLWFVPHNIHSLWCWWNGKRIISAFHSWQLSLLPVYFIYISFVHLYFVFILLPTEHKFWIHLFLWLWII